MKKNYVSAYYYSFDLTGCDPVDGILRQVAAAGKAYHNTDCWADEQPDYMEDKRSYVDRIQDAANEAAKCFDQWQPIETAPKDGTKIDILLNGKSRIPDVYWGEYGGYALVIHTWLDGLSNPVIVRGDFINEMTHWMPIAQPPKQDEVA